MKIYNNSDQAGEIKNFILKDENNYWLRLTGLQITGDEAEVIITPVYRALFCFLVGKSELLLEFALLKGKSLIIHIYQFGIKAKVVESDYKSIMEERNQ